MLRLLMLLTQWNVFCSGFRCLAYRVRRLSAVRRPSSASAGLKDLTGPFLVRC